ncbi:MULTISPECIES: MarR family transcriptional regulator [Arthrobacter]|uniref:MarR family transcriptional regulator n=2 Tax=Arthrobacter TaxID=1663 RepID=A0ABU9KJZ9_9MICC|nr:MarR family transcriptional regulator [Arthrobacter sp. YJM1]MDP5227103.1 MarR family transcriptional regulator [Arthrobacter sp. YJM1]
MPQRPARIGFLLAQLGAHAADIFAEQTRSLGITPSEAGVIRIVARNPGISQRALADRLGAVQSRVVTLVDRLESAGLVSRTRSESDRRMQLLALTNAGESMLGGLRQAAEEQEKQLTSGFTEEQKTALFELLSALGAARGLDAEVHPGYRS